MKKILSVSLIFCLVGLCAAFFNNNKKINSQIVIQFASWGSESEINILKPIIKDFETENPNIKIDFMHIPQNYFQKIHLLFASNTAPDVIFINNQYLPIYANAGLLEDLSSEFDTGVFYEKSIQALSQNGKIYAIPRDLSNLVIFYNKDLFKKYGVKEPFENWDLDDLLDISKEITHLPNVFGISFDEFPLFYLPYMTTCGGWSKYDTENYFNKEVLHNETNAKGLNFYANLRKKYHLAPTKSETASATMSQMFLQERIAMQISGRWMVRKYRQEAKFEWDVIQFPACTKGKNSVVPLDTSGWAVSKSSKNKAEAIKLVKYLASQESIEKFTKSGLIVPARIDVAQSDVFLDNLPPKNAQYFLKAIQTSVPTPVTINYREILDDLKSKTEYIFN